MSRKYTVVVGQKGTPAGTVVYRCIYNDYGCAADDTNITGVHHISVTLQSDGNYPFFTIPYRNLKEEANVPVHKNVRT